MIIMTINKTQGLWLRLVTRCPVGLSPALSDSESRRHPARPRTGGLEQSDSRISSHVPAGWC